jgi:hypothetical protein
VSYDGPVSPSTVDDDGPVLRGPRGLLARVLLQALGDVHRDDGHARTAAAWLFSDRGDHLFTFRRVCETLDLSPAEVRRAARNRSGSFRR